MASARALMAADARSAAQAAVEAAVWQFGSSPEVLHVVLPVSRLCIDVDHGCATATVAERLGRLENVLRACMTSSIKTNIHFQP